MDNGFSTSDAVLTAAMSGGLGGRGGGQWGNGYYGASFADVGSNAVRLNRNADLDREGRRNISLSLDRAEESRQFSAICDRISNQELRQTDRLRDLENKMDSCCCETQKEILRQTGDTNLRFAAVERQACEDKSEILAEIKAVEARQVRDLLDVERAQRVALETRVACGCVTGCSTPCS